MSAITRRSTVAQRADPVSCAFDGGVIVMSDDAREFYDLNRTASAVWARLERPQTVGRLCDDLARAYGVDATRCEREVIALLGRLADKDIVRVVSAH
jgi:hypothetical protein